MLPIYYRFSGESTEEFWGGRNFDEDNYNLNITLLCKVKVKNFKYYSVDYFETVFSNFLIVQIRFPSLPEKNFFPVGLSKIVSKHFAGETSLIPPVPSALAD